MTSRMHARARRASLAGLASAIAFSLACSSGSGSAPYEIVSPSTQNVVVLPGVSVRFEIRANAFCHQMVRSIVGTLVDVGLRKLTPGDLRGILGARDREAAGQVAPPYGLTLWEVGYPFCP